jgi:Fe-S-cluster-containing dehydrogenase component
MKDSPQSQGRSRRSFLKALGLGSAALAVPSSRAKASGEPLATLHDLSLCIGCGACVEACRSANAAKKPKPEKPFPRMYPNRVPIEDWSDRQEVDNRLTPYNWIYVQSVEIRYGGQIHEIHIPRRCMHCSNPPCANLCPWGAAEQRANGIVRIHDKVCLGGAKCRTVCPWHIPQRQTGVGLYKKILPGFAGNGVLYKCDRCYDRIDRGELPACIVECPMEVQTIGPRSQILARAHRLAAETNGFIYGEDENGGTNTIYVSPVPFDLLDRAITQGKGMPQLAPVPNMMAAEENLGWAVLAAPVAGIAAGLLRTGSALLDADSPGKEESADEQ